ncbi:hypothetical protein E6O75_ATG08882 [Venturia nashicola]|uniref:Uncharacterized protein n=1 Tax=Venturia nashicola TaxID=86259 RepID=A0A4Z1NUS9_9PEZI|nr:hypothetical protein E6O75_ATG08882 [Venturia nashicola]
MADRLNLSAEHFGKRRKRARPPGLSQQATTNWRQKWSQFSQDPQVDSSESPFYPQSDQPTQPAVNQNRRPAQTQRPPKPMAVQVVDLTEDIKDEESEANRLNKPFQDSALRFDSGPFCQEQTTVVPRARNADFASSTTSFRHRDHDNRQDHQDWDRELEFEENDYEQAGDEPHDWKYSTNRHNRPSDQRREFEERQPRQQRMQDPRRERQFRAHRANYRDNFSPGPRGQYAGGRHFEIPEIQHPQDYASRGRNLTANPLHHENRSNARSETCNVKQWLKTSVPTPSAQYPHIDQQRASQLNFRRLDDSIVVNVPDSQESSTVDDHDNIYSYLGTSFAAPPLLDQRAHQLKLDLKERFARIRLQNAQSSKIRSQLTQSSAPAIPPPSQNAVQPLSGLRVHFRDELPDGSTAATLAKRQKVSQPIETGPAFDPFEPPPGTPRAGPSQSAHNTTSNLTNNANGKNRLRIPPEISTLSEAELRKAQKEEEERTAARIAREREKLLEQDEELQRIQREERQAQLRIELDEAKAARIEEHQKRMAIMEEKQRAIDEKVAKHKAEEDKRKAAQAEKERLAKKEELAAIHEAALQRSIKARKEHEALKAKKAASIAARREECKGPPAVQKSLDGPLTKVSKPSLNGTLPTQQSANDKTSTIAAQSSLQGPLPSPKPVEGGTVKPRTGPKTPGDRRKEVEDAEARAEAQEPLGLREVDLQNLLKKEKAEKQAAVQRQRGEKRKQKEKEQKSKQLRREERREEKEEAKLAGQDRPRKRPVKLSKPGTIVQTTLPTTEAPKRTFGGFLEDDSETGSSSNSESDEDALFCSATKGAASVNANASLSRPPNNAPDSKAIEHIPHTQRSMPKLSHGTRPTTGGKTLNPEVIAAYLESLRELRDADDDEDEADIESDVEEIVRDGDLRQQSPITDRDVYRYHYRVERKTWSPRTEEEATEWTTCGKSGYPSLQEANAKADKEATRRRLGHSLQPCNRKWVRELDESDMVHIYMDCTNNQRNPGYVKIRVVRQLHAYSNGVRPATKFGWLRLTAYEIRKTIITTTIIPSSPRGNEDGEQSEEETEQVETTEEIEMLGNEIFTNVDEANRKAANLAVDLAVSRPESKNLSEIMAYQKQREENLEGLIEICDQLEEDGKNGVFEATYQLDDAICMRVEVVARPLVGPRNI